MRFEVVAPPSEPADDDPAAPGGLAGGGRVVHPFSTRVTLREATPNGEECGPTVRRAGVRVDPRKGLVGPGRSRGRYGTQWLPETVIITWSWMLAEK
ncbi:hypothetical protein ACH4Q7_34970 [Streptomyces roseolus]|uniref:hypothetical protein n=1 Tax=Streptomyces roseolus TaxID=67358 RepID=UPI0037A482FE